MNDFYRQTVLQDGPIAYWRLGELSGTSIVDQQALASGTIGGSYTLGRAGAIAASNSASINFFGGGGSVSLPNVAALNLNASDCSFEAWIQTTLASLAHIVGGYTTPSNFGYGFAVGALGTGHVSYWSGGNNGGNWYESASAVNDGTWKHVVVTVTASTTTIFINGAQDTSKSDDLRPTNYAGTRTLASRSDGLSYVWAGSLQDVAIYNFALSAARVKAHYQAGIAQGLLAQPVGNCPFIRGRAA